MSTPSKFDRLVTTLTTTFMPTPLTFEELSSMIMEEEMRLKVCRSTDEAHTANEKGKGKAMDLGNSSNQKKNMKYFYIGKKGHMEKECEKKQENTKNSTLKKLECANVVKMTKIKLFITMEERYNMETHDDVWIIDNRAS